MKKLFIILILFMFPIIVLAYNPGDKYISGDADNSGKVTSTDYIVVRKHILKQTTLKGDALTRGDVNGDNKITSVDYISIRKMILNGKTREVVTVPGETPINPTNLNISYDKKTGVYDTCATVSDIYYECTNYLNIVTTSTNATKINYIISKKTDGKYSKISEKTISGKKATIKLSGDGEYEVKAYPLNSNGQKGKEITRLYTILTDQYQHGLYSKDGIEIRVGTKGKTNFFEPNKWFTYYFKVKGKKLNNAKVTNTITSKTSGLNISKTDSAWNNKTITVDDNERLYTGTFNVSKNGIYTISININGIVLKFDVGIMPKNKKANEKLFYYGVSPYLNRVITRNAEYRVKDQGIEKSIASIMETATYMGINIIRDGNNWKEVQPNINKENYNFEVHDRIVNTVTQKYDLKYLWLLLNTRSDVEYYKSTYLGKYQTLMKNIANRYAKNNNIIWSTWNEPDLKEFFGGTKDEYLAMLKVSAKEIKKVNSKAIVTAGGLAVYYNPTVASIETIRGWKGEIILPDYKKLLADGTIDTFAIHNHKEWNNGSNGFLGSMNDFDDNLSKNNLSTNGLYVLESGNAEVDDEKAKVSNTQAFGLANKVLYYRSKGYKMFIQFSMLDVDVGNMSSLWNKAIFNRYLEPRDAAIAYGTVIRFLGQAKLTNGIYGDRNGSLFATIYYDESNNTSIIPVFSITDNGKSLVIPSGAKVYDMYGNIKTISGNTIQSTTKPVYVVVSGKVAKDKFKVQ